jgi:hypothetical protein
VNRPKLGQSISATATTEPVYYGRKRKWEHVPCKMFGGIFVEVRFKREGTIRGGYTVYDKYDDDDQRYLAIEKTIEVWLIAYNPFRNPVCVFPEDCIWNPQPVE